MGENVKPGHIVAVIDFSPDTLRNVIAHLEVSTEFEHFIFREAELGAIWSLTAFALLSALTAAQREDVLRLRHAVLEAYILLTQRRPLEALQSLQPFADAL